MLRMPWCRRMSSFISQLGMLGRPWGCLSPWVDTMLQTRHYAACNSHIHSHYALQQDVFHLKKNEIGKPQGILGCSYLLSAAFPSILRAGGQSFSQMACKNPEVESRGCQEPLPLGKTSCGVLRFKRVSVFRTQENSIFSTIHCGP